MIISHTHTHTHTSWFACVYVCLVDRNALCVCCRYKYIAVMPGHWITINLHLYLAAPSDRVPLTAHNNTQNAAGPCRPSLICGCRPGVEFNCSWLHDLLHFVGRLATSFSLHTGQNQWADMQRATPQQGSPAQTGLCVCVCVCAPSTYTQFDVNR